MARDSSLYVYMGRNVKSFGRGVLCLTLAGIKWFRHWYFNKASNLQNTVSVYCQEQANLFLFEDLFKQVVWFTERLLTSKRTWNTCGGWLHLTCKTLPSLDGSFQNGQEKKRLRERSTQQGQRGYGTAAINSTWQLWSAYLFSPVIFC